MNNLPPRPSRVVLTSAQKRFLVRAAGRRDGQCYVGRGQGRMARDLESRGLGYVYYATAYGLMFGISATGREAIRDA